MDNGKAMNPALQVGKPVPKEKLQPDLFEAHEGFIQLIYGRVRQGKSTEAVRRMVEALSNGISVYSNIALDLSDVVLDDRVNIGIIVLNNFLLRKRFYSFSVENYHFFDPVTGLCDSRQVFDPATKGDEIRWLNTLTDCEIYYDEGQWLLDSYESTFASIAKRKLITESGHMNRLIVIIAQRTQSVHVNARGNVNQFYRCSKHSFFGLFNMLMVEEFQDMKGQDVDEISEPVSVKRYFTSRKYWKLFNTHYLRRGRPRSQEVKYEAFDLNGWERIKLVFLRLFGFALFKKRKAEKNFLGDIPPPEKKFEWRDVYSDIGESLGVKLIDTTIKNNGKTSAAGVSYPIPYEGKGSKRLVVEGIVEDKNIPF